MKKQYWIVLDTETTMTGTVADAGAVVTDRKGNIVASFAGLLQGFYGTVDLFHNEQKTWNLERRYSAYQDKLGMGERILCDVEAFNLWLGLINDVYRPTLTAYNLAFDSGACAKTGIDLGIFENRFCLWHSAVENICKTKAYKNWALRNKRLTEKLNVRTDAESVAGFVTGNLIEEPHTAMEDVRDFEMPILLAILKKRKLKMAKAYNWKEWQAADLFTAK
jgi:hypothetical protein